MVVFYQLFRAGVLCHHQDPATAPAGLGHPTPGAVVQRSSPGLLIGFALMFVITGMTAPINALIAVLDAPCRSARCSATYLVIYSLSAIPGMLLLCLALTAGAMRPDRDPGVIRLALRFRVPVLRRDHGGIPRIGSLVLAILIDNINNVLCLQWFGYLNLCNALTEIVVSPAWIASTAVGCWPGTVSSPGG